MKGKTGPDYDVEFSANSGCFKWVRNHYSLCNVKLSVESVSADIKEAEKFSVMLDKLIVEGNYLPRQIFNTEFPYSGNRCLKEHYPLGG